MLLTSTNTLGTIPTRRTHRTTASQSNPADLRRLSTTNTYSAIFDKNAAGAAKQVLREALADTTLRGHLNRTYRIEDGRLVAPIGLLPRLQRGLAMRGYKVKVDGDPVAAYCKGRTAPVMLRTRAETIGRARLLPSHSSRGTSGSAGASPSQ